MDEEELLTIKDIISMFEQHNAAQMSRENPDPSKMVEVPGRRGLSLRLSRKGISPIEDTGGKGRLAKYKKSDVLKAFPIPEDVTYRGDFFRSEEVPTTVPVLGSIGVKRGKKGEGVLTYKREPAIGSRLVYRPDRLKNKLSNFDRQMILRTGVTEQQQAEKMARIAAMEPKSPRGIYFRPPEERRAYRQTLSQMGFAPSGSKQFVIPRNRNLSNQFSTTED